MLGKQAAMILLSLAMMLAVSANAIGANILFISAMDDATKAGDDALKSFLESLGHTVTYFDDDATEADTEVAAAEADVVFISESVTSQRIRLEITEIATPMVITEAWAYDEMGLTIGTGEGIEVATTDIEIVAPQHQLAAGLSGTVPVLTELASVRGTSRFATGNPGPTATVVARATLSDGATYDVIWVYEKDAVLPAAPADGSPQRAADIRVCLGFDELSYLVWNDNAYALFRSAINFALGVRTQPEAYGPSPSIGKTEVARSATLSWMRGLYADTHDVYFGTDFNDVNEATVADPRGVLVSQNQKATTWDPGVLLDYGVTYYWRIDEVNAPPDSTVFKGSVWSFTVLNFLVVDNFESYTDDEPNRVFDVWSDGWENPTTNGAVVGYANPNWAANEHYIETLISRSGKQSMPFFYNNDKKYSEAYMALSGAQSDWARDGVAFLSLWFRGFPAYVGGFVQKAGGAYEVTGAGVDIWGKADEFHFAYKEVTSGACVIIVKVESLEAIHKDSKAGVMIRDSLDAGSVNAALTLTPDPEKGLRFQVRATAGADTVRGTADMDPNAMPPYWLKLERTSGGLIRASRSADGSTWTLFDLKTATMQMPVYIGLAVTSHTVGVPCTGVFSNVTVTGAGTDKPWTDQDIGMKTNAPDPMYVALNGNAVVYNDDPNAATTSAWTEWRIPLQKFADQGTTLANVSSLAIGAGTKGNTTEPGGAGQLFIDDIRLYRP
ncbi:MAG: hypothetical protein A2Y77_16285 [Planctomycetes bacterium RBG_13_62_9]|nr:MAG: hypothetical protein A2Y77_16285 [Planctomycetes bacterium RBG_13_62_9]